MAARPGSRNAAIAAPLKGQKDDDDMYQARLDIFAEADEEVADALKVHTIHSNSIYVTYSAFR